MKKVTITLPDRVAEKLAFYTKKGKRSEFIAEAISEKIKKQEKKQAYEEIANLKPIKTDIDSVEMLRKIRQSRADELSDRHEI